MATMTTTRPVHAAGRRADVYASAMGYESADPARVVERERVAAARAAEAEAERLMKIEAARIAAERAAADAALEKVRAAAPLLLDALRDCMALIERDMLGDRTAQPELIAARSAIAAATN